MCADLPTRKLSPRRQFAKLALILFLYYIGLGFFASLTPIYTWVVLKPSVGTNRFYTIDSILGTKKQELSIPTSDGKNLTAWLYRVPETDKVVVVHHGNAGDISHRLMLAKYIIESGASVILYDYRGYGTSTGSPSLRGLIEDGLTVHDYLVKELKFKPESIVEYGESIGSGVACEVASKRAVGGLILQSGIKSLPAVARDGVFLFHLYPDWIFPSPHFDNTLLIKNIRVPKFICHGQQDKLVPFCHSERLYSLASEPKAFVTLPHCGHNDIGIQDATAFIEGMRTYLRSLPAASSNQN